MDDAVAEHWKIQTGQARSICEFLVLVARVMCNLREREREREMDDGASLRVILWPNRMQRGEIDRGKKKERKAREPGGTRSISPVPERKG